ncbi:MAG: hypothetical protein K2Y37_06975 [Pirellulales bacterium]|nr:hypothetical protein [Pirellulales bacterium]
MRLTLRTLLAYLDDLLDPADADQLSGKIKESEFASNLVVRIRDSMRRLRLGVPSLKGRGMGVDPNTVAEYLDNTMPAERVPEFERVCLESDVHLAEVASCHQVVSLVLSGHPVEIEPASRQRMYALLSAARAEAEATAARDTSNVSDAAAAAVAAPAGARRKPEIPDYLRESTEPARRPWVRFLAAAAIVLLAGGVWLISQGRRGESPVARNDEQPQQQGNADAKQNTATDKTAKPNVPPAEGTSSGGEQTQPTTATPRASEPETADTAASESATEQENATASPSDETTDSLQNPDAAGPDRTTTTPPPVPGDAIDETTPDETSAPADAVATDGKRPADESAPPAPEPALPAEGATPAPTTPAVPQAIGRLVSEQSLLLAYGEPQEWERVPAAGGITSGQKLLALPGFRPTMSLNSGVTLRLIGASQIKLLAPDAAEVPGVELDFGRMVAMNTGRAGGQLRFHIGDLDARLTFGDASAVAAIEVYPVTLTGSDPEAVTPPLIARLYAASGAVEWEDLSGAKKLAIEAPKVVDVIDPPPGFPAVPEGELPPWATGAEMPVAIEQLAADFVIKSLPPGQPARLALKEFADNRRIEVRAMAARSLALLGDYEPLIEALNLESERPNWPQNVDALRFALALGPEHATLVRETFIKLRRENSTELYRLLWGYTPAQLEQGEALKLVDRLDHPALDMRVLAFLNLRQIAGLDYGYRPEKTEISRQPSLRKWRQWAERIGPASAPRP